MRITPPAMTMAGGVFRCFVRRALPLRGERVFLCGHRRACCRRRCPVRAVALPWACRIVRAGMPQQRAEALRTAFWRERRDRAGAALLAGLPPFPKSGLGVLPQGRSGPVQAGCGRYQPGGHGVLGRQRTGQNGVTVRAEAGRRFLPLQGRQGREKGSLWGILQ